MPLQAFGNISGYGYADCLEHRDWGGCAMNRSVGIIGHFGGKESFCDGQTVKTKNLEMLFANLEDTEVRRADTYYFEKNPFKLLLDTLKLLLHCQHIFLMVSVKGMKFYLPFLYYVNAITRRNIYHYVIGSELLELTAQNPGLVKYLNALTINWFEYDSGSRYLQEMGVQNVETLPNCKVLSPVHEPVYCDWAGGYRFSTFSRVMEEKGITEAIEAVARINDEAGRIVVKLDVYGPVERGYAQKFDILLKAHKNCVRYCGIADSAGSVDILKQYYALLFPTHWAGEGVPGTVIDAFAAGIPVIASDWNANRELISHHRQGLLYPERDMPTLYDAVSWAINHSDEMDRMRVESRKEYTKYMPETILATILQKMEKRT